jgi:hypothetical protein
MNPLIQMMARLQQAQNPMGLIQQMFSKNPQFAKVMEMTRSKSPQEIEALARNTAKTQGVDLNQVFNQLGLQMPPPANVVADNSKK